MMLQAYKIKSTSFFLSNERYKTLRWQKLTTEEDSFKVGTASAIILQWAWKKNTSGLSKLGYLDSSAQPILADVVSYTLQKFFCAQILL